MLKVLLSCFVRLKNVLFSLLFVLDPSPLGLSFHGGDVAVYVFDINQPSLPTLFILFTCLFLCFGLF